MQTSTSGGSVGGYPPQIQVYVGDGGLVGLIRHHATAGSWIFMDAVLSTQQDSATRSDVYVGVVTPDGRNASWVGDPQAPIFVVGPPVPFLADVILTEPPPLTPPYRMLIHVTAPEGWYMLYGLVVGAGQDPGDPRNWRNASFFPLLITKPETP